MRAGCRKCSHAFVGTQLCLLVHTILLVVGDAARMKDLRGDLSRLQQMNLLDAKVAENQTQEKLMLRAVHPQSLQNHSRAAHSGPHLHSHDTGIKRRVQPDHHPGPTRAKVSSANASQKVSHGDEPHQPRSPLEHSETEPSLGSSLNALEQDPRWNSVMRLSQEADALKKQGAALGSGRALGNAFVVESAVSEGPENKVKLSGAAGFFLDPATGGVKVSKKAVSKTSKGTSPGRRKLPVLIKSRVLLPHPSADWVQNHLKIQEDLHQKVSDLHAKINQLTTAPQQLQAALKLQSKAEAQVQALKHSKETSAEAALEATRQQTQADISEVSAQLRSRSKAVDELQQKKGTWHTIASAAADPHNRTHVLRAHALSDALGTQVLLEERGVRHLREDVTHLQSMIADKEQAVEKSTGTASVAGIQRLVKKSRKLKRLEQQQSRLEAAHRQETDAIKGVQVRAQTATESLSRVLEHLSTESEKTMQYSEKQNMTLRRAQDAMKLLELEQSGLKRSVRAEIPGMRKVIKVKDALAAVSKVRRKQWTRLVELQEKLPQIRKLSLHEAKMKDLRTQVSMIQSRNEALQHQLHDAATDLLSLHEQEARQTDDDVVDDSAASSAAEKHALAEQARLKEQLRQLQHAWKASIARSTASNERAVHRPMHRHRHQRKPSLLQQGSWLENLHVPLKWRTDMSPIYDEAMATPASNSFQDGDGMMFEDNLLLPAEQLQEDRTIDEEGAVRDEQALEDAMTEAS